MLHRFSLRERTTMSLRSGLLLSIVATLLLSLAAGAAFAYWHAIDKIETEMQAAIAVGGRIAHNAVDDAEEAVDPPRRLSLLIADFDGDRHLRALLTVNGKVLRASRLAEPENPAPAWFHHLLADAPKVLNVELPPMFSGYGSVALVTDANNEVAEVWSDIGLTLTVLTTFCVLLLVFVYVALSRAIHSLRDLTGAFARVGDRDYRGRVPECGPYEFVRLYQGFNRMVDDLARAEAQNKRLQEQLATVQDEERADLARDLHDEVGPMLFAADVDAATIERLAGKGEYGGIVQRVGIIRAAISQMQRHVRDILGRLRPAVLLDVGLAHAIDNLVSFWTTHRPGLVFHVKAPEEGFGETVDGTIYRVVQESVSNAVRHGSPTCIDVTVEATPQSESGRAIFIRVTDDGGGLKANGRPGAGATYGQGHGIIGMGERVVSLGGSLEVKNRPDGSGVVVEARLPSPDWGGAERSVEAGQDAPQELVLK
jgi:two-component system, NarL family, sensor histidine kinase UhpB